MIRQALLLSTILMFTPVMPTQAGIGLGEWEIETPGRSFIGKSDTYPAECGICLVSRSAENTTTALKIHASHMEWWQYHTGYISGKAKEGFFLFNERHKAIQFFPDKSGLDRAIVSLRLKPTAKPMTPQDGWNQVWLPILERCKRGKC